MRGRRPEEDMKEAHRTLATGVLVSITGRAFLRWGRVFRTSKKCPFLILNFLIRYDISERAFFFCQTFSSKAIKPNPKSISKAGNSGNLELNYPTLEPIRIEQRKGWKGSFYPLEASTGPYPRELKIVFS